MRLAAVFAFGSLVCLATCIVYTPPAQAATIYIDPSATTPGDGSMAMPFADWTQITISAGNSYLQKAGTVATGTIGVLTPATSASPVYIGSYGTGALPIIEGEVLFASAAYVTIENFEVRNSRGPGIQILTNSEYITVQGLTIYHCAAGVAIASDAKADNLVANCTIYENDMSGVQIDGGQTSATHRTTIQGNTIYRNGLHGIQIHGNYYVLDGNEIHSNGLNGIPGTSGVHIYAAGSGDDAGDYNIVRNNRISHQQDFDGFDGNGVQADHYSDYNEISDNVIFENDGGGVFIHDSQNCQVLRNTLYGNMRNRGGTRQELGEIDLTSKSTSIDRVNGTVVMDNIVVAVNPDAVPILVDGETADNTNFFGGNGFYHENGGDLWWVSGQHGRDMTEWNSFASGSTDDYAYDPIASGFSPPAEPPANQLDTSFTVHSDIFTTVAPNVVNILLGGPGNDTITGDNLGDTLVGNGGDDTILGGPGDDWIVGGAGNDMLSGETGNDFIVSGLGDDMLDGGDGDDNLSGGDGADALNGGDGNDQLLGVTGNDQLYGGAGNDSLDAGSGDDRLEGGLGDDLDLGGAGNDIIDESSDTTCGMNTIFGEEGDDTLTGGCGQDTFVGGPGADVEYGGDGDDVLNEVNDDTAQNELHGGSGNDSLVAGDLGDTMYGDEGNDIIVGGSGADTIDERSDPSSLNVLIGNAGDDTIYGGGGDDFINGGAGADTIDGGPGDDTIDGGADTGILIGGPGFDVIVGGNAPDLIDESADTGTDGGLLVGNGGDDDIRGGTGPDLIYGNVGNDTISGGAGGDRVFGATGDDTITLGDGNDFVSGGIGADQIFGENGNDILAGGAGNDTITGGAGDDALNGDDGDDMIDGGDGLNVIVGGAGNDQMTGAVDADNFAFDSGSGSDVITYFGSNDILVVTKGVNGTSIATAQDLWDRMTDTVNGVLLDLGAGNEVLLQGITLASLNVNTNLLARDPVDVEVRIRLISVPEMTETIGNAIIEVPVSIDQGDGIDSIDFDLLFNSNLLTYLDYSRGSLLADWSTVNVTKTGDTISLHASDASPLDSGGVIVRLRFQVRTDTLATLSPLNFANAQINAGDIPSISSGGIVSLAGSPALPLRDGALAAMAMALAILGLRQLRRRRRSANACGSRRQQPYHVR